MSFGLEHGKLNQLESVKGSWEFFFKPTTSAGVIEEMGRPPGLLENTNRPETEGKREKKGPTSPSRA